MPLYLVPAVVGLLGIDPALPDLNVDWVGIYDEDSFQYVVRTGVPLPLLTELVPGMDVGFSYDPLLPVDVIGSPQPHETGQSAGTPKELLG